MTNSEEHTKPITIVIGVTFTLFLIVRIIGAFSFDNNWSFTQLFYIPIWYYIVPLLVCTSFYILTNKENNFIYNLLNNRLNSFLLFGFLLLLFLIFQFDSFIYGGGNYKIHQIAQTDSIIYRFYEYGSVFLVSLFYKLFSLFEIKNSTAGVYSWKLFSYLGTVLTCIASLLISKTISETTKNRFLIFIIIFFGPQTLSYFGFVGNLSFISASIYFFIYYGLQFERTKSFKTLAILWIITLLAITVHISLLLLLPALLFITFSKLFKQTTVAYILGITTYACLLATVFWMASSNFEFAKQILFIKGMNIRVYYSLFSLSHFADFLQLLFLFVPQVIIVKFLIFKNRKKVHNTFRFQLVTLIILSANTLVFISEPTHSIIFDAPLFAVYFSPLIILLVLFLSGSTKNLRYLALFSLFIPLITLPSYTNIDIAEKQIEVFLEKNHHFYIEGSTALQDSYFQTGEIDKANYWYLNLPKRSRDFLDFTAASEYTYAKMYPEALRLYYQLKIKSPFWGEPRYQIASILITQKQFNLARPEIDTCLMISPYEKDFLKLDYSYYRDLGDFNKAKEKVFDALLIYPNDYDMQTDLAIIYYRLKDIVNADSTAKEVLRQDPSQTYAYLIRGFIAEIKKQPKQAIAFFKEFVRLAPDEPETPDIRKRLNNLILQQQN